MVNLWIYRGILYTKNSVMSKQLIKLLSDNHILRPTSTVTSESPRISPLFLPDHVTKTIPSVKKVKVKKSHYRPEEGQRVPGGWGSQISRQSAHEGGKVVSPTHRPLFTPRKYSRYSFLLEAESTPGPQCGQKDYVNEIPMTPSGIEPATFWLVVQCLNQLRHRGPPILSVRPINSPVSLERQRLVP